MRRGDGANAEPPLRVAVSEPVITEAAKRYVADAMADGWISSGGPAVARFEEAFARYLGVGHAVATSSGTTALHLALVSLGIGPGDEVIVPDFTMLSPVAAVLYTGARPVLVDCEGDTFCIDAGRVADAVTARTRAIVAVHLYGHSADMDPLLEIAMRAGIPVVEDAAEAHGATYRGRKCGAMGHVGCFSFYGNKIVTTGEGGMVVTDDAGVARRARKLRDMAHTQAQRFLHDDLGFSYRMGNLQAAVGLGQLESIGDFLAHKRWMASEYGRRLSSHWQLRLPVTRPGCVNVHWMYAVLLSREGAPSPDAFRAALRMRGIDTRAFFVSAARQPVVRARAGVQGPFPVSEDVSARGLYLPSGLALTQAQIELVCDAVADALATFS